MIAGVKKQYPDATQSVLQKLNMKKRNLSAKKIIHNFYKEKLKKSKNKKYIYFLRKSYQNS